MLCDTTVIAELELKLGGFQLYVSRYLAEQNAPSQPHVPAPVSAHVVVEQSGSNGSASSSSLALSKPISSSGGVQTFLDKAVDEGMVILQSPRIQDVSISIVSMTIFVLTIIRSSKLGSCKSFSRAFSRVKIWWTLGLMVFYMGILHQLPLLQRLRIMRQYNSVYVSPGQQDKNENQNVECMPF